jgi:diguanylate cyclase (GGDEF)-like protein
MPGMDGRQVLKRLRDTARHREIPVVVFTTSDAGDDQRACHELGCAAYVRKPASFAEMVGLMKTLVSRWLNVPEIPDRVNATEVVRVLMIDDDEDDAVLVRALLARVPGVRFELEACRAAVAGLEQLRSGQFDVCLLDELLEGFRGSELLSRLSETPLPTPVIMLTAIADRSVDLGAMKAGAADYLVKQELRWEVLDRAIRYAIERGRLIATLQQSQARLRALASVDELTGLFNRRHFVALLPAAVSAARRHGHPLSLCMWDLDDFKQINDHHGHLAGDTVLSTFGSELRHCLRTEDTPARLGGDEFVVLMPFTTAANARVAVSRLQSRFHGLSFDGSDGASFCVSTSCGVAELKGDMDGERLLAQADAALYAEKARRRSASGHG